MDITFHYIELNTVYTVTVRAVTSQGHGPSTALVIYPNGGGESILNSFKG